MFEGVLVNLVLLSVQASFLMIAVLAVRALCKRIPRRFICFLWCLVALRLLIPVSLESSISLVPSTSTLKEFFEQQSNLLKEGQSDFAVGEQIGLPEAEQTGVIEDSSTTFTPNTGNMVVNQDALVGLRQEQMQQSESIPSAEEGIYSSKLLPILTVIWLMGMLLLLGYGVYGYVRIKRQVREAVHESGNIWLCDRIDAPFLLGYFRPRIYIPFSVDASSKEYIIAHEKSHMLRGDHLTKLLGYVLLSVYWFQPFVWVAYILFCRDVEMACDERVIADLGEERKKEYSKVLLLCSADRHYFLNNPLAFGEIDVKKRILNVLQYQKPGFWVSVLSVLVVIAVSLCFLTGRREKQGESVSGTVDETTDVTGETTGVTGGTVDAGKDAGTAQQEAPGQGSQAQTDPQTQIALTCFAEYAQVNNLFSTNLIGTFSATRPEEMVDFVPVKDERFSSIRDIKNYIEQICTEQCAQDNFYSWMFNEEHPYLFEKDHILYSIFYDGPTIDYPLFDKVDFIKQGESQMSFLIMPTKTEYPDEIGVYYMRLENQEGKWMVAEIKLVNTDGGKVYKTLQMEEYTVVLRNITYGDGGPLQLLVQYQGQEQIIEYMEEAHRRNPENYVIEPFEDICGYNGFWVRDESWFAQYYSDYYVMSDDEILQIAHSFGGNQLDNNYVKDLDGDGINELICNVTYGADGVQRVIVYKRFGNEVMCGNVQEDYLEDWQRFYLGAIVYVPEDDMLRIEKWNEETQGFDTIRTELDLNKLHFVN